jgi:hypothetical protein
MADMPSATAQPRAGVDSAGARRASVKPKAQPKRVEHEVKSESHNQHLFVMAFGALCIQSNSPEA